jgi:hypothetical protein
MALVMWVLWSGAIHSVQVRTTIAFGILDESRVNGVGDQYFDCLIQHFASLKSDNERSNWVNIAQIS